MSKKVHGLLFLSPLNRFPVYPLVTSIENLVRMRRQRILIDVVGKVISGRLVGPNFAVEMILQDQSGYVIKLVLNVHPGALPVMLAYSIRSQWVIYVYRVKHCQRGGIKFKVNSFEIS